MKTNRRVISIVRGMIICAASYAADFGAYYSKVDSGQDFERYSRTGEHADIVARLERGKFVFWRGSSYLPYWQTDKGKWLVPEIVERKGDGPLARPDKVNTYSRVKIIESNSEKIGAYPWNWRPVVQQGLGDERSYALEVGPFGHVRFGISLNGSLRQVKSEIQLERKRWYHVAGVYDGETGRLQVFVDAKQSASASAPQARIAKTNDRIHIGKGRDMVPVDAVRPDRTFADAFTFDGLLDEVRIYDEALSPDQIRESYAAFGLSEVGHNDPDLEQRALPSGKETNRFGAYYVHFPFHETWDGMFRFGPYPDVMVEFDEHPTKFAFWRGTCFIPMLVNHKGHWYSNEFNETWNRSGGLGCQEPMSDKESFSNHVRIIESTPARVVVQWRYPLVDVLHTIANFNEKTGWGDWSSWYYHIYPDGVAVKRMRLWSTGPYNHEWHEAMAIPGPDQHPENVLETDPALELAGLDGTVRRYSWTDGPPRGVNYDDMKIHLVNYSGEYDPFTIGDFTGGDVYGGELTDYSVFPAWNHWPVGQMPSDGPYTTFPDRTAHSSLTHVRIPVHRQQSGDRPYQERLLMEGMTNKEPDELTDLAKSWLQPAALQMKSGAANGGYDRRQRAYLMAAESSSMKFSIEASPDSPIVNPCFVIRNWG